LTNKEDAVGAVINEMYGIASELSISPDKTAQDHGKQLRKLLEQLEHEIAASNNVNRVGSGQEVG